MAIKIAIIENQKSHFDDLCKLLVQSELPCNIFPEPDPALVVGVADLARISLDDRYREQGRQGKARSMLQKMLEDTAPDIVIIDRVLLGFSRIITRDGKHNPCGIKLWQILINDSSVLRKIPVLFLSSTLRNDPAVLSRLKELKKNQEIIVDWESKKPSEYDDYSPFGDLDYFNEYIVYKINKLVNHSKDCSLIEQVEKNISEVIAVLKYTFSAETREHAQKLVNFFGDNKKIPPGLKEKIELLNDNIEIIKKSDQQDHQTNKGSIVDTLKLITVLLDDYAK